MNISAALFTHIRIIIGVVIGLGLTHLLRHASHIVEHPHRNRVWWVHLVWVFSTFLYLVHFWWWEFHLDTIQHWNFLAYLFLILYAVLLFLLCALLFPEDLSDYNGYRDYFLSRKQWFFGVLTAVYLCDFVDTWLKGPTYLHALGPEYIVRGAVFVVLGLYAMRSRNVRFHGAFAVLGLLYQISFILRMYLFE